MSRDFEIMGAKQRQPQKLPSYSRVSPGRGVWKLSRAQTLVVKLSLLQAPDLEGRGSEASAPTVHVLRLLPLAAVV